MLYDSYYKKISKIADFWKKVFKHIVLIGIALGVILAAVIAFMVTKGIVFDDSSKPDTIEITYGSTLSMDASALFSDVSYEYSVDGGTTWSAVAPTMPGEYKLRAVSEGVFGQNRYGKVYSFVIAPKQVEVKIVENEILYGELLSVTAKLQYEDTISCKKFKYADITKEITAAEPDISGIEIINKDGENVTAAYSLVPVSSDVKFLKRDISVVVEDRGTVYNGLELKYDGYGIVKGTTAEDDKLIATISQSLINVGEIQGTPELKVIKTLTLEAADGGEPKTEVFDVTNHYNIEVEVGKLKVDYRPLIVESLDKTKEYDAKPLSHQQLDIKEGTLADGQSIVCTHGASITDPGKTENILSFEIKDAQNNDTSSNYSIIYIWGTLEVLPREITVKTDSIVKEEYDGKELKNTDYTISVGYLAEGHTSELLESVSITNAGEIINSVSIIIKDAEGNNKTVNYNISEDFGTITVHPRRLTVSSDSKSWIYDGMNHSTPVKYENLCEGHEVRATDLKSVIDVDEGEVKNEVQVLGIYDAEGNAVIDNYLVNYGAFGTIKIDPRPIEIAFKTVEFIYSGKAYSSAEYENPSAVYAALLVDDEIQLTMDEFIDANEEGYENKPIDLAIYSNERQMMVTDNYDVKITAGKVIIHKFKLNLKYKDYPNLVKTDIYNGEALVLEGSDFVLEYPQYPVVNSLPSGHSFEPAFIGEQINAGIYVGATLDFENTKIVYNGEDVSKRNFELSADKVDLKVEKRGFTVYTGSSEKMYDGTPLTNTVYTESNVLDGHTVVYSSDIVSIIDVIRDDYGYIVGTPNEIHVVDILNENGESVRLNYVDEAEIDYEYGTLKITLRRVEIKTESRNVIYDGFSHKFDGYEVIGSTPLAEGDKLVIDVNAFVDANENGYDNEVIAWAAYSQTRAKDVTGNYDIRVTNGTVTIEKFHLKVVFDGDKIKTYDGNALVLTEDDLTLEYPQGQTQLPVGHIFKPAFIGSRTEVGVYKNATLDVNSTKILRNAEDVKRNFNIEANKVNLIVLPSAGIVFKPADVSRPYNGQPLNSTSLEKPSASYLSSLADLGYSITYDIVGERTFVGTSKSSVENVVIKRDVDGDGVKDVVTNEFSISYEQGSITVSPRDVYVEFEYLKEKTYDGTDLTMTASDYTCSNLPSGHRMVLTFSGAQRVKGESLATLQSIAVSNASGNPVDLENFNIYVNDKKTDSYPIENHKVTLKVHQRLITVTSGSAEKYYDGSPLTKDSFTVESYELSGERSNLSAMGFGVNVVLARSSQTEIGETNNKISSVSVTYKGVPEIDGENVKIERVEGVLKVTKGSIVISVNDKTKIYDGTPLTQDDVSYTIKINGVPTNKTALENALGANITISKSAASVTNVSEGKKGIEPNFTVSKGGITIPNSVIEKLFDITLESGYIQINPRELTVVSDSNTWIYDGRYHSDSGAIIDDNVYDEFGRLGFTITVTSANSKIRDVGSIDNEISGVQAILGEKDQVANGNVTVTIECGTLTVVPRRITVIAGSAEKMYDGTPLTNDSFEVVDDDALNDYPNKESYWELGFDGRPTGFIGSQTEPGQSNNEIYGFEVWVDGEDAVAKGNIIVFFDDGTLTVTNPERTPIKLIVFGVSREYNGQVLAGDLSFKLSTDSGLAEGHTLMSVYIPNGKILEPITISPDDLRDYESEKAQYVKFVVVDENGEDVSYMYYLDAQIPKGQNVPDPYYIVEIKPRHIQLTTGSATAVYKEGATLSNNSVEISAGSLADGESMEIWGMLTKLLEKGSCDNEMFVSQVRIYDANGRRVDDFYDIEIIFGTLEFT